MGFFTFPFEWFSCNSNISPCTYKLNFFLLLNEKKINKQWLLLTIKNLIISQYIYWTPASPLFVLCFILVVRGLCSTIGGPWSFVGRPCRWCYVFLFIFFTNKLVLLLFCCIWKFRKWIRCWKLVYKIHEFWNPVKKLTKFWNSIRDIVRCNWISNFGHSINSV